MNAIEVNQLSKRYNKVEALRGMSFSVPEGSLCGLIGLNGAGKTTTLKILMEMLRPDSGEASVMGLKVGKDGLSIREKTAFVPEGKKLFPYMTVGEVIQFTRPFYRSWNQAREVQLLKTFELPLTRKANELSKGMLAKLQLLLAFSRGSKLIILDEPTDGLDAIAVEETLQEMATQIAEEGATVLFCSHRMEEIEQMVDHLVVVHEGRCLMEMPIDSLRTASRRITAILPEAFVGQTSQIRALGAARQHGRNLSLTVWREPELAQAKLRELGAQHIEAAPIPLRQLFVEMVRSAKGESNAVA